MYSGCLVLRKYVGNKFECIGKTALINEFCKDKPTIFLSATGNENLEALSKSILSFERPDIESASKFLSYDAALDELAALSRDKRIVFVIDEYPYLAKAKPQFQQYYSTSLIINGQNPGCI